MIRKVAAPTTYRRQGTSCAGGLLATMNNVRMCWVADCRYHLWPSGSSIVTDDCLNMMGIQTTISIGLLPAAPKIPDCLSGVWQTGEYSIHDCQMVGSMMDVTNRSIDSSSLGQCNENTLVVFSTTLIPGMTGST